MNDFLEPTQITEGMKQGLARMYADSFMREYLLNAIGIAKNNAITLIEQGKVSEAQAYASRAKSLVQLLQKGKEHFTHFEGLKKKLKLSSLQQVEEIKL